VCLEETIGPCDVSASENLRATYRSIGLFFTGLILVIDDPVLRLKSDITSSCWFSNSAESLLLSEAL